MGKRQVTLVKRKSAVTLDETKTFFFIVAFDFPLRGMTSGSIIFKHVQTVFAGHAKQKKTCCNDAILYLIGISDIN